MKIKTDVEFTCFDDGICNIYYEDEAGVKNIKYNNLGFSNRVLGFKRFYEAAANKINVNRVIRIPKVEGIDNFDSVDIDEGLGVIKYGVKLVQQIYESNPPSIDLTLDKAR